MEKGILQAHGISAKAILNFYKEFTRIGGENHGMIISHGGERIYEEYCPPYREDMPHSMFSVTKCLVSLAVGFAIQEGLFTLDTPILPYFEEYPHKDAPEWSDVTVRNLLLMNSNKKFSFLQDMTADHAALFMKAPFRKKKGFQYSNNDSHILAALVEKVSGEHLDDYLNTRLFTPLDIKKPFWEKNDRGVCVGGSGVFLTCSDLHKIGECVASGGVWKGKQILPTKYVKEAVQKQTTPSKTYHANGFGYYFWQDGETYRLEGLFGQFSVVVPAQNTVVTITSMHPSDALIASTIQDVLIAHLFEKDGAAEEEALDAYLEKRKSALAPISAPREPALEALAQRSFKRKGIITSLTKAFTHFTNGLIPNSIHSSYPDRPADSFDNFTFSFKENTVEVAWTEGEDVQIRFEAGLDGVARESTVHIRQWTYTVWAYAYWKKGKLHLFTRALNTLTSKEFIFTFSKKGFKVGWRCQPDFSVFCGFNSVAGGTIPTIPLLTPILVGGLKAALSITRIRARFAAK